MHTNCLEHATESTISLRLFTHCVYKRQVYESPSKTKASSQCWRCECSSLLWHLTRRWTYILKQSKAPGNPQGGPKNRMYLEVCNSVHFDIEKHLIYI